MSGWGISQLDANVHAGAQARVTRESEEGNWSAPQNFEQEQVALGLRVEWSELDFDNTTFT